MGNVAQLSQRSSLSRYSGAQQYSQDELNPDKMSLICGRAGSRQRLQISSRQAQTAARTPVRSAIRQAGTVWRVRRMPTTPK